MKLYFHFTGTLGQDLNGDRIYTLTDIPVDVAPWFAQNYGAGRGFIHDIAYRRDGRWEASPIYEAIFGLEEDLGWEEL